MAGTAVTTPPTSPRCAGGEAGGRRRAGPDRGSGPARRLYRRSAEQTCKPSADGAEGVDVKRGRRLNAGFYWRLRQPLSAHDSPAPATPWPSAHGRSCPTRSPAAPRAWPRTPGARAFAPRRCGGADGGSRSALAAAARRRGLRRAPAPTHTHLRECFSSSLPPRHARNDRLPDILALPSHLVNLDAVTADPEPAGRQLSRDRPRPAAL